MHKNLHYKSFISKTRWLIDYYLHKFIIIDTHTYQKNANILSRSCYIRNGCNRPHAAAFCCCKVGYIMWFSSLVFRILINEHLINDAAPIAFERPTERRNNRLHIIIYKHKLLSIPTLDTTSHRRTHLIKWYGVLNWFYMLNKYVNHLRIYVFRLEYYMWVMRNVVVFMWIWFLPDRERSNVKRAVPYQKAQRLVHTWGGRLCFVLCVLAAMGKACVTLYGQGICVSWTIRINYACAYNDKLKKITFKSLGKAIKVKRYFKILQYRLFWMDQSNGIFWMYTIYTRNFLK